MVNEQEFVNVNILLMDLIVKNVYHSTMMHLGDEQHLKMFTNARVSEIPIYYNIGAMVQGLRL